MKEGKFLRGCGKAQILALSRAGYMRQAAWKAYRFFSQSGVLAMYTIEFFRVRDADDAHATLGRVEHDTTDLEDAKVRARSLFETLDMPQKPDALRIVDQNGDEVFFWSPQRYST